MSKVRLVAAGFSGGRSWIVDSLVRVGHAASLPAPACLPAFHATCPQVLDEGRNHASTFLGTPLYLSPEICNVRV